MIKTIARFIFLMGLSSLAPSSILAAATDGWIKDEALPDRGGTLYLSPTFERKSGRFSATPESVLDDRTFIEGTFLVGTFRVLLNKPEVVRKGTSGKRHDEIVTTEIIDCDNGFYGTLRKVEKLNGKVVSDEMTPDEQVSMLQTSISTVDKKLCQLHAGKSRSSLNGPDGANPTYNPNPTDADIDEIIDAHSLQARPPESVKPK